MTKPNLFQLPLEYFKYLILSSILLLPACASFKKESVQNSSISSQTPEQKTIESTKEVISPIIVSQQISWNSFEVMIIQLDKNKQPQKSAKATFEDEVSAYPFGQGANNPKINISTFPLIQNKDTSVKSTEGSGRVLQLSCGTTDLKQKFDSPNLLKGWAVEFNCSKNSFFVIINDKK